MQCSVHVSALVVHQLTHALSNHLKFCITHWFSCAICVRTCCNTRPLVQLQHWLDFVRRSQKPSRFSLAPPPPYQLPQAQNSSFVSSLSPLSTIPWASTSVMQYICCSTFYQFHCWNTHTYAHAPIVERVASKILISISLAEPSYLLRINVLVSFSSL